MVGSKPDENQTRQENVRKRLAGPITCVNRDRRGCLHYAAVWLKEPEGATCTFSR
jgi:hypothetical protein